MLASAGLPPLGGFVSEWLLLQSFLFTPGLPDPLLNMLIPVVAALIALVAALAGYTMVKFFGVIFLGQPREEKLPQAHDAGRWERVGMVWLVARLRRARPAADPVHPAHRSGDAPARRRRAWATRSPPAAGCWRRSSVERASYGPVIFLLGVAGELRARLAAGAPALPRPAAPRRALGLRLSRGRPRACRTRAEGFGQPIRQIFEPFFRMRRELPSPFDAQPRYRVTVEDHFWHWLYLPIAAAVDAASRGWSACCSRGASRSTCCTASSR